MRTIIVDMDGTISDASHRSHHAQAGEWDEFHSKAGEDPVREDMRIFLTSVFDPETELVILTGRNEKYRQITKDWLDKNGLSPFIEGILMRPDGDFRSDVEVKIALLEEAFGSKEEVLKNVAFCLDDRDRVVQGFRDYGLVCWQVKEGDY